MSSNVTYIKEMIEQKVMVLNNKTGLMEEHQGVELRVYDQESFDKFEMSVSHNNRWVGLNPHRRKLKAIDPFFTD